MVARTLSLKAPLRKIWNGSASFRGHSEVDHQRSKAKRPRSCRVSREDLEGKVRFVSKDDLCFGPLLGEGGFAQVFGLFHNDQQEEEEEGEEFGATATGSSTCWAVKTIRKGLLDDKVLFQKAADDLVHETEILARLALEEGHPAIIKLRGMSKDYDKPIHHATKYNHFFLLLDRLSETLSDRIQDWKDCEDRRPSLDVKMDYAFQLAQALEYLHERRILFRDLKPENIGFKGTIAQNDHKVQLFDFGMARELPASSSSSTTSTSTTTQTTASASSSNHPSAPPLPPKIGTSRPPKSGDIQKQSSNTSTASDSNTTSTNTTSPSDEEFFHLTICGTQRYMSQEVLLDGKYTLKSDCYTWAMVVWEIVAEAKPFHYMTPSVHKILVCRNGERPPLSCYGLPEGIQGLLETCWAHRVGDRIPMSVVCEKLKPFVKEAAAPPSSRESSPAKKQTHRRTSSHGFFLTKTTGSLNLHIDLDSDEEKAPTVPPAPSHEQEKKGATTTDAIATPPKSQASTHHRRTNSHGSFLFGKSPRIPLEDIPVEPQQRNNHSNIPTTTGNNKSPNKKSLLHSPKRPPHSPKRPSPTSSSSRRPFLRTSSHGNFSSPPPASTSSAPRILGGDFGSPTLNNNTTRPPAHSHRRTNSLTPTTNNLIPRLSQDALPNNNNNNTQGRHRRTNSHGNPNTHDAARIPLLGGDITPERKNRPPSSFINSKPAPGKFFTRRTNSSNNNSSTNGSSSLTNSIITRITRIPMMSENNNNLSHNSLNDDSVEEDDSNKDDDDEDCYNEPPPVVSPQPHNHPLHRRNNSHSSFLTNNIITKITRIPLLEEEQDDAREPAPIVSPIVFSTNKFLSASPDRSHRGGGHRRSNSHGSFLSDSTVSHSVKTWETGPRPPSLTELQDRKRDLKEQLKQFDISFAQKQGRMPNKTEKELIRPLYNHYNALKAYISDLESLKNKLKQYDMQFARKHGRMPCKAEKEVIRHLYTQYKALKAEIGRFLFEYEHPDNSEAEEAHETLEMVCGQRSGQAFVTFHSFDSDLTPEMIEVAEL